jgi:hypothetical protein
MQRRELAAVMKRAMAKERLRPQALLPVRPAALRPLARAQLYAADARHFRQSSQLPRVPGPAEALRSFRDDVALPQQVRLHVRVSHAPNERGFEQPDRRSTD